MIKSSLKQRDIHSLSTKKLRPTMSQSKENECLSLLSNYFNVK